MIDELREEIQEVKKIKDFATCDLVEELSRREGVEKIQIEPYKKVDIKAEGPIVILKVID